MKQLMSAEEARSRYLKAASGDVIDLVQSNIDRAIEEKRCVFNIYISRIDQGYVPQIKSALQEAGYKVSHINGLDILNVSF